MKVLSAFILLVCGVVLLFETYLFKKARKNRWHKGDAKILSLKPKLKY